MDVKCAQKGVREEEVQRENLCEMGELDLAASSSASFAASAVTYRQIQTCKWPLLSNCPLLWALLPPCPLHVSMARNQ